MGQDMNRNWHVASEFTQPELHAIRNVLKELDNSDVSWSYKNDCDLSHSDAFLIWSKLLFFELCVIYIN